MTLDHQLSALVSQARAAVAERAGRLVALFVAAPHDVDLEAARAALAARLGAVGLGAVEVVVEARSGPLRVVRMEFQR